MPDILKGRRFSALFTLFLFCSLTSPAVAGEVSSALPPAREQVPQVQIPVNDLSVRDALLLGNALLERGDLENAEKIFTSLQSNPEEPVNIEANFQLAQIRLRQGRFRQAIVYFLNILNRKPNLPRVRLELARAYFLNRDYEDAQLHFELVKGGDLPPEVLEKVDTFLALLRRKKDCTFDFNLALTPDSNISQASGGEEECIALGGMLLCRPLEKKRSGLGLTLGGTFNHYLHFNRDFGLRSTIGLNMLEYERRDFDDYQLYLASGPRWTFESGEVSAQPTYRRRWYGGQRYNEEYGLRLDGQKILDRFVFSGGSSYAKIRYDESHFNNFLRGDFQSVDLQSRYIVNDRTFIQAGLSRQRQTTKVKAYGSDSWRYGLGAYHIFPYGFSLFGELSLTDTTYRDKRWYVTRDNRIDIATREDQTWQLFTSLSSNLFEKYNITPMLQYVYTKRDSNMWSQEYERHRVSLSFNYKF